MQSRPRVPCAWCSWVVCVFRASVPPAAARPGVDLSSLPPPHAPPPPPPRFLADRAVLAHTAISRTQVSTVQVWTGGVGEVRSLLSNGTSPGPRERSLSRERDPAQTRLFQTSASLSSIRSSGSSRGSANTDAALRSPSVRATDTTAAADPAAVATASSSSPIGARAAASVAVAAPPSSPETAGGSGSGGGSGGGSGIGSGGGGDGGGGGGAKGQGDPRAKGVSETGQRAPAVCSSPLTAAATCPVESLCDSCTSATCGSRALPASRAAAPPHSLLETHRHLSPARLAGCTNALSAQTINGRLSTSASASVDA